MSSFPKFRQKHGPPADCRPAPAARMRAYRQRLPSSVLDLWQEEGWCSYAEGLLWFVDPEDFRVAVEAWFDRPDQMIVFGRTAFADLFLWDGEEGQYLDVQYGKLTSLTDMPSVFFEVSLCTDRYLDTVIRRKLYRQAVKRLGKPAYDECYAFEPVLALGGSPKAKSLSKVKVREHLVFLAEVVRE
ncbi:MAG: GAD-like domain-containing protein [Thermoanaerobaculia bacterium]